jgi:hypothetical protein
MNEDEFFAGLGKSFPRLNKTTLVGQITSVAANPAHMEILLGFRARMDPTNHFQVNASIPCSEEHMAEETLWYAKLWKKERFIALEGAFHIAEGVFTMTAPDVTPISQ